jgi:DNA polymerase phi
LSQELKGCAEKMFASSAASSKPLSTVDEGEDAEDLDPMDLLVDVLIGFLERPSAQLRALASQVFGMLSGEVSDSTIDLLLAVSLLLPSNHWPLCTESAPCCVSLLSQQLEQRPVTAEDDADEDVSMSAPDAADGQEEDDAEDGASDAGSESSIEFDEEDENVDVDPELRKRIAEALQVNGADIDLNGMGDDDEEGDESDGDELLMDDDQMLALDDKLAEIFKGQIVGRKGKKGTSSLSFGLSCLLLPPKVSIS